MGKPTAEDAKTLLNEVTGAAGKGCPAQRFQVHGLTFVQSWRCSLWWPLAEAVDAEIDSTLLWSLNVIAGTAQKDDRLQVYGHPGHAEKRRRQAACLSVVIQGMTKREDDRLLEAQAACEPVLLSPRQYS